MEDFRPVMFPGLGISLDNGSGPVNYIVTGVYPHYGYATVINAAGNAGGPLAGGLGTIYSCSAELHGRAGGICLDGLLTEKGRCSLYVRRPPGDGLRTM